MSDSVPVRLDVAVSVAVIDCDPAVSKRDCEAVLARVAAVKV